MKREPIPQFEFGFAAESFNLAGDTGARLERCAVCGWRFLPLGPDDTYCGNCKRDFAKQPTNQSEMIRG